jgi:PAS domain S-box-containing protein
VEIEIANLASPNKKNVIRVLHVDDDSAMLEISKQILMDLDSCFEFDSACCADEAFKKLSTGQYDIVISDYEMPQKDGLQFLKELRDGKNEIPFILFTGKGREEVVIQALNLGADYYVNKHGSPETVYSELKHLVSSAVEKSRAKLKNENDSLTLHYVHDAIVSSDANFMITAWNKAAEELFGFSSDEVLQKKVDDVFQKIQVKPSQKELNRQLETTGHFQGEVVYQNKNGQRRYGELNIISIISDNDRFLGNVAVCKDITERKKAEEALIVSEKNHRNLINGMGESAWVGDFEGNFVEVNNAAIEMLGYSREELLSLGIKGIDNYLTPEQVKNSANLVVSGKNQVFETVHTSKNGTKIPVEISSSLISYQEKPAILAIARNITERKKAEKEISRLASFPTLNPNPIFEADFGGKIIYCNPATKKLFPDFEDLGLSHPFLSDWNQIVGSFVDKTKNKFGREVKVAGHWYHETFYFVPETDNIRVYTVDIDELQKAEEMLRKSEEEYSSLFANMIDGFAYCQMIFDETEKPVDFIYLQINDAFETITGLRRDLIVGKRVTQAIPGIKEANPELFEIYGRVALSGKKERFEVFFKPLGLWLSISVYCPRKGYFVAVFEDVTQRKKIEESLKESEEKFRNLAEESPNIIFINKQGKVLYANKKCEDITGYTREEFYSPNFNFLSLCSPEYVEVMRSSYAKHMRGEDAPPYDFVLITKGGERIDVMTTSKLINYDGDKAILGIVTDISDLKKAQDALNQTMDELVNVNEKLGVVGSLTRHDVRNKLSAVNGYAYLLKKKHKDQADIVEGLSKIEQAVADSVKIFDFAKMYEQLGVEELTYIDVGKDADEAAALFSGLTIKIVNECHGKSVLADSFLRQMFYNFIDNTRKYGKKATTIKMYCQQEKSGKLNLIYEDDGVGISAENKSRLFTEGFSTGGSTGFGLFLIKKMMDVYGWSIVEEGEQDKGAKFIITIPDRSL